MTIEGELKQFVIAESQVERKQESNSREKDPKINYVVKLFSNGPAEYDFLLKILSLGRDNFWRDEVVREADVQKDGLVLDIACGTGLLTNQFVRKGARVVGVDVTREMLRRATKLSSRSSVDFIQARAENLPLRSDVFDAATISLAMRNVSSQRETLEEMRRCVRPDRKVINLDFVRPRSFFFKPFYHFYIFDVLPAIGLLISKHWNLIFLYLANSIERAREPEQIGRTMQRAGLRLESVRRMTQGTTAIVSGTK